MKSIWKSSTHLIGCSWNHLVSLEMIIWRNSVTTSGTSCLFSHVPWSHTSSTTFPRGKPSTLSHSSWLLYLDCYFLVLSNTVYIDLSSILKPTCLITELSDISTSCLMAFTMSCLTTRTHLFIQRSPRLTCSLVYHTLLRFCWKHRLVVPQIHRSCHQCYYLVLFLSGLHDIRYITLRLSFCRYDQTQRHLVPSAAKIS